MKKAISAFLLLVTVLSLSACFRRIEPEEDAARPMAEITEDLPQEAITLPLDETAEMLREVLENKRTLITGDGQAVYLKDYPIHETLKAEPCEYTFVDFDGDGRTEAAVNLSRQVGVYLVLREYGQKVFGYPFTVRAFLDLKTDGSFVGSGGAGTHYYRRMTFEGEECVVHTEAVNDVTAGVYEISGQPVSAGEAQAFADARNEKENAEWQDMSAAFASDT